MRPLIAPAYPPATASDLEAFEQLCGQTLPGDYREFLLSINGGEAEPPYFRAQDDSVQEIGFWFGLHDTSADSRINLFKRWNVVEYLFDGPQSLICIGSSFDGNLLLMSLDDMDYGILYLWYRDASPKAIWQRGPAGESIEARCDRMGMRRLADSFTALIEQGMSELERDAHFLAQLGKTHD